MVKVSKRLFHTASDEEIKQGGTTDIYFVRTREILEAKGLAGLKAYAEVTAGSLPRGWPWGVLCGVEEVANLLEGYPVDVDCLPEGSIFRAVDHKGLRVPVLTIEGPYGEYGALETPLLGLLCQASGIATQAARFRKMASNKLLISFGIRRMHPALSPMIDRAAYIGGMDGVSSLSGARAIGKKPMGTMPHALIIAMGGQKKAWLAFDEVMGEDVPRIALVDTYYDEKEEAIMAAEALGSKLYGIRLDTPSSRKGDFADIVREVRWELGIRGYGSVKIIVSGGINEESLRDLVEAGVDGFGIGTSLSNAPTIDFAMDIVDIGGRPVAKRGKLGGKKDVFKCPKCIIYDVEPSGSFKELRCPSCGGPMELALKPLLRAGKRVSELPSVDDIRSFVISQLSQVAL